MRQPCLTPSKRPGSPLRRLVRALCTLLIVALTLAPVANAHAAGDDEGGFEKAIDDVAGYVVRGLDAVLFYPILVDTGTASASGVVLDDDGVGALLDEIEALGIDPSESALTLTVPNTVDEEVAAAAQRRLAALYVPTAPKGTRSLTVTRSATQSGTSLTVTSGGMPIIALWLLLGAVFFTLRMGFINVRAFRHAIDVVRGRYDNPDDEGEVSHFQALASALSATVGLGNIAGVAIAVAVGGPGAVFWMMAAGVLGMSSKFVECTLGQKYRETRPDGRVMGGPMFYLQKGLSEMGLKGPGRVLAIMFAVLCIGGSVGGGNTFQVSQSLGILQEQVPALKDNGWIYGVIMSGLVGVVIIGGIKRIAATAEKVVPAMCGVYVLACLYILLANAGAIPDAFGKIFGEAFTPAAGYGGFAGVLVTGIRRAAFSNEAGVGSAAIAHSAARTEYPVREGVVALLEPFIDTVVVCTMTGLVIVITGAYADAANFDVISASNGAALTARAMGSVISWFPWLLSVAVMLFAYSTMISWSYYGERCFCFLFGDRASMAYRILFLAFVFLGSVVTATNILNFGDLMILSMAVPNIIGLYLLSGGVKKDLDDYLGKLKSGQFRVYTAKDK